MEVTLSAHQYFSRKLSGSPGFSLKALIWSSLQDELHPQRSLFFWSEKYNTMKNHCESFRSSERIRGDWTIKLAVPIAGHYPVSFLVAFVPKHCFYFWFWFRHLEFCFHKESLKLQAVASKLEKDYCLSDLPSLCLYALF